MWEKIYVSLRKKKCRPVSETRNNLRNASKQNHQISLFSEMPANSKNSDQPDSQTCQQTQRTFKSVWFSDMPATENIRISLILRNASKKWFFKSAWFSEISANSEHSFKSAWFSEMPAKSEYSDQPDFQKSQQKRIIKSAYFSEMSANSEYSDQPPSKQPIFKSVWFSEAAAK